MFLPHYTVSPLLLESIKRIAVLVHDLNRRALPEVVLLRREAEAAAVSAHASTSIEGNPLPLTEVRRLLKNRPERPRESEREVLNYNRVLLKLNAEPRTPLTHRLILEIHRGVMEGLLPEHQCGRYRQEPVVVHEPHSGDIIYLPPDHQQVEALMGELLAYVEANRATLDAVLLAGVFHKRMVIIHPFMDGNGRSTRLATKLLLAGLGLDTFNLFSFENYYNQNVTRYFRQVGLFGDYYELAPTADFTEWLEYFAGGIIDELLRVQGQLEREPAARRPLEPHLQIVLDYIDQHGGITDREYGRLTERAKATRSLDFKKLIDLGLITHHGRGRATYYTRS